MIKSNVYKDIYPNFRYFMSLGRKSHKFIKNTQSIFSRRPDTSKVLPDAYTVCNTSTIDSDYDLKLIEGKYPDDIDGNLYLCQCLGTPSAFMVGDTNVVKIKFDQKKAHLTNRLMWTPVALAKMILDNTRHRFDYFGLMFLSPGLGMFSYTEGMYLLPDGRLAVTSDVDRPWIIERDTLRVVTPIGKRNEWLPMMADKAGEIMGNLFAGYSNSHVLYTDHEQGEVFLVNYQYKQADGSHPVRLIKWDGYGDFEHWNVVDEQGKDIEIKQSIHELIFTRDYILLADTAFIAGTEMLTPWKNAPLPNDKTVVYIIDRRELKDNNKRVSAKRIEVDEPCIHLIAKYDNPDDVISVYMLHTPATNTAEILKDYDRDLNGQLFSKHMIGYGTLPVLDLSSIGKHSIDMKLLKVKESNYIAEMPYCWGPYLYTYMGRQLKPFNKQDLFIMFKGFSKDVLPKRIYEAYKNVDKRHVNIEDMVDGEGISHNNSICRISTDDFKISDSYIMPDKVLLYTISCIETSGQGYVIAGVVRDTDHRKSSGHEYWIFKSDELSKGPICKLGHENLNNSTLFHTIFIPKDDEQRLDKNKVTYKVPLREDYPKKELEKWDVSVLSGFEEIIWPYFDNNSEIENEIHNLSKGRIKKQFGNEFLIGEDYLVDAPEFADKMFDEVNRLVSTTGWKEEINKRGLLVESKPISGPLASSGVLITRASGIINASAQLTFDLLVSPEGYAVIDPVSRPEDHEKSPLEIYDWHEGCRLEAAIATTKLPFMPECDFVVLNAIDPFKKVFASKSILHKESPGGSKYSKEEYPLNGNERALNTFAIKVEAIDNVSCRVLSVNYADMAGKTSGSMNNFVNTKVFFKMLYNRINKAMSEKK
ncbi:carotenoid oxygenase family protein [Clostridiaceae bacterium HSG29]|nr:carotenoid oxygenase family protein [Clostridiaceae bacterium HSG29]